MGRTASTRVTATVSMRRALGLALAVSCCVAAAPALAQTQSVTVNYEALERLPRHGSGAPAPKLTPLSMVSARTRPIDPGPFGLEGWGFPEETLLALANPMAQPGDVPFAFARRDAFGNPIDETAAERLIAAIMGRGLTGATVKRPTGEPGATAMLEDPPLTRLTPPALRPVDKAAPPSSAEARPPSGETKVANRSAAPSSAARAPQDGPPPLIDWNEANPLGAVHFAGGGVGVLDIDRTSLDELDNLARHLAAADRRVLLKAFAGAAGDKSDGAHIRALKRGLAVRLYLIAKGVPSTLIDVRAAGGATDGGPLDRVDVVPAAS